MIFCLTETKQCGHCKCRRCGDGAVSLKGAGKAKGQLDGVSLKGSA